MTIVSVPFFLQLIFLMEAGDVIHQFSEEIFHRVSISIVMLKYSLTWS